jgi:hypothetical protein
MHVQCAMGWDQLLAHYTQQTMHHGLQAAAFQARLVIQERLLLSSMCTWRQEPPGRARHSLLDSVCAQAVVENSEASFMRSSRPSMFCRAWQGMASHQGCREGRGGSSEAQAYR